MSGDRVTEEWEQSCSCEADGHHVRLKVERTRTLLPKVLPPEIALSERIMEHYALSRPSCEAAYAVASRGGLITWRTRP